MKLISVITVLLLISFVMLSCVKVTTERKAEVQSVTPGGEGTRSSEVTVRTYGWDFWEVPLHIVLFPFKVVYYAIKIIF